MEDMNKNDVIETIDEVIEDVDLVVLDEMPKRIDISRVIKVSGALVLVTTVGVIVVKNRKSIAKILKRKKRGAHHKKSKKHAKSARVINDDYENEESDVYNADEE